MLFFVRLLLLFFFSSSVFAWNSAGHRVIAQIAYDQLTPQTKKAVDALTEEIFHSPYPDARFLRAATWPDQIKSKTKQYNTWHYIDLPILKAGEVAPPRDEKNVVWAIERAEKIVGDTAINPHERAMYLSFLIHFVGDIHQPLHCATLYDKQFPSPRGDQGGNLYRIHSPIADYLHPLWDAGLGLFYSAPGHYRFRYDQVEAIAHEWMQLYPPASFGSLLAITDPMVWANESHAIAANFVYQLAVNATPSQTYLQLGQVIVKKQAVLAGDRLAAILNQLIK